MFINRGYVDGDYFELDDLVLTYNEIGYVDEDYFEKDFLWKMYAPAGHLTITLFEPYVPHTQITPVDVIPLTITALRPVINNSTLVDLFNLTITIFEPRVDSNITILAETPLLSITLFEPYVPHTQITPVDVIPLPITVGASFVSIPKTVFPETLTLNIEAFVYPAHIQTEQLVLDIFAPSQYAGFPDDIGQQITISVIQPVFSETVSVNYLVMTVKVLDSPSYYQDESFALDITLLPIITRGHDVVSVFELPIIIFEPVFDVIATTDVLVLSITIINLATFIQEDALPIPIIAPHENSLEVIITPISPVFHYTELPESILLPSIALVLPMFTPEQSLELFAEVIQSYGGIVVEEANVVSVVVPAHTTTNWETIVVPECKLIRLTVNPAEVAFQGSILTTYVYHPELKGVTDLNVGTPPSLYLSINPKEPNYTGYVAVTAAVPPIANFEAQTLVINISVLQNQSGDNVYHEADVIILNITKLAENIWERIYPPALELPVNATSSFAQPYGDKRVVSIGGVVFDKALYWSENLGSTKYLFQGNLAIDGSSIVSVSPLGAYNHQHFINTYSSFAIHKDIVAQLVSLVNTNTYDIIFTDGSFQSVKFDLLSTPLSLEPTHEGSAHYYIIIKVLV